MASRKLVIEVVGDASKLDKTFKQAATSTNKFGRSLDGVTTGAALSTRGVGGLSTAVKSGGLAIGLGLAAQKAVQFGEAASDLNEQISKSRQVFGPSSVAIEDWSLTTARALGISQTAALEAAGTFGNLFATVKLAPQQAATMSRALVQLASDLASFNNADPSEVLQALQSGLVGEAEPLRRFGVLLSEVKVQQQAMADTGKKNVKALTDQEKTIARYELILRDTTKAQGDFARTSGGLANQQRILKARLADSEAELGKKLLPVLIAGTGALIDGIDAAERFGSALSRIKGPSLGDIKGPGGLDLLHTLLRGVGLEADKAKDKIDGLTGAVGKVGKAAGTVPGLVGPASATQGQRDAFARKQAEAANTKTEQRNRFFDEAVGRKEDRVQDIASLRGQVRALGEIEGLIEKRIAITKDITRRLRLEDELVNVRRQRRSVIDEIAADAKADREKAEDARREAEKAALARTQTRQLIALGDVTPGVENLRKQFKTLQARLASSFDDTGTDVTLNSKLKSALEGTRKILNGELGKASEETRTRIQALFDTIRGEFDKQSRGPLTKTKSLNANAILSGLGLSPEETRKVRARLSTFNSAGQALAGTGGGAFGVPQATIDNHVTVVVGGQKVEAVVTKQQQKRRQANPTQKRG